MVRGKAPALSGVESLNKKHDLSHFNSGKPPLDEWLREYARANHAADSSKTYVVHRDGRVVGYYTLTPGSIKTEEASARAAKGQPIRGSVPIIVLARLAVDQKEQGQGLGNALLKDALLRCEQAVDLIGGRAVLVHALDAQARKFYLHYNFDESPVDELMLMLLMKDLRGMLNPS